LLFLYLKDNFVKPFEPVTLKKTDSTNKDSSIPSRPKNTSGLNPPAIVLQYEKPEWSSDPPVAAGDNDEFNIDAEGFCSQYFLEVIKNGTTVDKIRLDKEYKTIGRVDECDILAEHPTISRQHALFQYSK
jgi:pSer/pThr/pTyr-binding forkhead associated (FHA) protein